MPMQIFTVFQQLFWVIAHFGNFATARGARLSGQRRVVWRTVIGTQRSGCKKQGYNTNGRFGMRGIYMCKQLATNTVRKINF